MYNIRINDVTSVVEVETSGFWDQQTTELFVRELKGVSDRARQRTGKLRLLVDARNSPVQGADTIKAFEDLPKLLLRDPRDKIAVVVGSQLAKLQTERTVDLSHSATFLSMDDAAVWLADV